MHLGYEPVRELLEEYGLADSEVGLGDKYLARERKGKQRKVWDLQKQGDYTRADLKGQDFDDWILSTADRVRTPLLTPLLPATGGTSCSKFSVAPNNLMEDLSRLFWVVAATSAVVTRTRFTRRCSTQSHLI